MSAVRGAVAEALWAMCAADAMSMPVHWYYDVQDIRRDFGGWIVDFRSPLDRHPSSILTISNTAGSGRSAWSSSSPRQPDVVGNVILHNKLELWKSSRGSVHYHHGLQAGENTLNVLCALRSASVLLAGALTDVGAAAARAAVIGDYVDFLTAAGSHGDSYAESNHRSFFADWQHTRPTTPSQVLQFAESRSKHKMTSSYPDSQLDAIGCLPAALPFVLLSASANQERAVAAAVEFSKLTHPHPNVPSCVSLYGRCLHAILGGASVARQAEDALRTLDVWDVCQSYSRKAARFPHSSDERLRVHQSAVNYLGLACYTKGAMCSLFYLANEFHDDVHGGILANTNCGGENCNRGAALGALLGAGAGYRGEPGVCQQWKEKLKDAQRVIPGLLEKLQ